MAVYKRGNKWVADSYLGGRKGRRMRLTAPTRKLAEAAEREAKATEFRGELGAVVVTDITLDEFVEKYLQLIEPTKSATTQKRDSYTLAHLQSFFRNSQLRSITSKTVEAYKAERASRVRHTTVNWELDLLKGVLSQAVAWGYLKETPAIKRFRVDMKEPRFLTLDEGRTLIAAARGQMRTFLAVALHTGLRKGELFALRWKDIDLDRAELRVRKGKGKRFRLIPLNAVALGALRLHPRHITSSYVFHNGEGSGWKDIRHSFYATLERAGLPRIRIHDLRHSFVSNLVMAGVDVRTVQELAGHRSIQTTMNYVHLRPGALKDGVAVLKTV